MITSFVNSADLAEAIRRSRELYSAQPKTLAALERAVGKLSSAIWTFDDRTAVLRISSATTPGVHYEVDFYQCSCLAGKRGIPCWHSFARDLIQFAIQIGYEHTMPPAGLLALEDAAYEAYMADRALEDIPW